MNRYTVKFWIGLMTVMMTPGSMMATTIPEKTQEGAHWRVADAGDFRARAVVAARQKEQILVWQQDGERPRPMGMVVLRVSAPYQTVQPLIRQTLQSQPRLRFYNDDMTLPYLAEEWVPVLFSRHPELRSESEHMTESARLVEGL